MDNALVAEQERARDTERFHGQLTPYELEIELNRAVDMVDTYRDALLGLEDHSGAILSAMEDGDTLEQAKATGRLIGAVEALVLLAGARI